MKVRPLTPEEQEIVAEAMLGARLLRPYYGRALGAMTPYAADGLGTVGVDRHWRLYLDMEWFRARTVSERAHLLGTHEVEHLLRNHATRLASYPRPVVLLAGDLEIHQCGGDAGLPAGSVTPTKLGLPDGHLAEEYAAMLLDLAQTAPCMCSGGSGAGGQRPGELDSPEEGGPAGIPDAEAERIRDQVADAVVAHMEAKGRGSVSMHMAIWADARKQARAPKIDWRQELAAVVRRLSRETVRGRWDYTWARMPRRQHPVLRPGTYTPQPKVGLVVDTSGSMEGVASEAIGHVEQICRSAGQVLVVQCDAEVVARTRSTPKTYHGGGGTDMRAGLEALGAVDVAIVITDCETPWPDTAPAFPMVVVKLGDGDTPPWARVVKVPQQVHP